MQLTVRDVARMFNVSEKTIYRWINQGDLPAYRVNEQYRFNRTELIEWATAQKVNVSAEIFLEPESKGQAMPGLVEALKAGGIYYRLGGTDKASVLREVVDIMPLPPAVDRNFLWKVLLAREALESTGIGEGIALPHVRNPIVLHVVAPMVTLCFLEHPVDFSALDGKPVFALFSLISPTTRAHLHLLSRIAYALRDPAFKDLIVHQRHRDQILLAANRVESALKNSSLTEKEDTEEGNR